MPPVEIMAETNETIRDAFNYLQVISNDEQKRLEYQANFFHLKILPNILF